MEFERKYYENESFWNTQQSKEDIQRIIDIAQLIPTDVMTLLDVGCGNGNFINYLLKEPKRFTRLHAVDRSLAALKYVKSNKTQASIIELPFSDVEFDLVSCLEVIEHLPGPVYAKGIEELARVANKYILISVPNNQDLEIGRTMCPNCKSIFNPDLHMRSFDMETMSKIFYDVGFVCENIKAIGCINDLWLPNLYLKSKKHCTNTNQWTFGITCPICGTTIPGKQENRTENTTTTRSTKDLLKLIWPKTTRYRWIVALYKKQI
jgi:2-polyprenyl-3-methyl-5-hydroxy-6-metoxy-1,4-benzoquinol methylase